MADRTVISGEIDTERPDAVRLPMRRVDTSEITSPRAWPRATREMTFEPATEPAKRFDEEQLRVMIWCALGGLLVAIALYLVL